MTEKNSLVLSKKIDNFDDGKVLHYLVLFDMYLIEDKYYPSFDILTEEELFEGSYSGRDFIKEVKKHFKNKKELHYSDYDLSKIPVFNTPVYKNPKTGKLKILKEKK